MSRAVVMGVSVDPSHASHQATEASLTVAADVLRSSFQLGTESVEQDFTVI